MDEQDNGLCSICLEDYCCSDVMRVLPCGHFFHQECVDTWMDTQAMVCPLCRTDLRAEEESPRKQPLRRRNPCALCFRGSSTAGDGSPSSGGGSTRGGTEGSTHRPAGGQGARAASADHLPV